MKQTTEINLTSLEYQLAGGRPVGQYVHASAAEELNQGLPRTNPASGQSGN